MAECGNVTSSVRALGIDVGSTAVKAVLLRVHDGGLTELAVAERPTAGADARGLITLAIAASREVLERAAHLDGAGAAVPIAVVGIASMAETGALVADAAPIGSLIRWDRDGDPDARLALAAELDAVELHRATGAPLAPKLPLLTWAAAAQDGLDPGIRWGFASDLVALALTGVLATDHTLAGRSGAYPLPPQGTPLGQSWDARLLDAVGVPRTLPPEIRTPGTPVGVVLGERLPGATGVPVHIAGHDHAVAAHLAGVRAGADGRPGTVVHSLGTTEAVLAVAPDGHPVDRPRAAVDGISVVRAVDGVREGVLAGSPSAGAMIADWSRRAAESGTDPAALLSDVRDPSGRAFMLPYLRGRQSPAPDPDARAVLIDADADLRGPSTEPAVELSAILRGLAAHGAWMRAAVMELTRNPSASRGGDPEVVAVGTPVRSNVRLARLMAALRSGPLAIVELAAPVAVGAALLALQREGLVGSVAPPMRTVHASPDLAVDLAERFATAIAVPMPRPAASLRTAAHLSTGAP
ncbi:FGGY family carbohydrate kinase [Naasia lichenicola]|nr:FGGY family carbohydrate kinase [Naasia lichenicola]